MEYYSQIGQDRYLNETVFKGKTDGFFVDIGAHNGITFSNSYFFETWKNWRGICVEPLPDVFRELKASRKCICIEGAIWPEAGYKEFLSLEGYSEMLSGLVDEYDPRHIERIKLEQQLYGGTSITIRVNTFPLQSVLDAHAVVDIDFCSIDTEGSELSVLKSIDFSKVNIHCLVIENGYQQTLARDYLSLYGYSLVKKLDWDDVFIHRDSKYFADMQEIIS